MNLAGEICTFAPVTATATINQNGSPAYSATQSSSFGTVLVTASGPASVENCYSSAMRAESTIITGATTKTGAQQCWFGPIAPPPPKSRNCTPIWDAEGMMWIGENCSTPILLDLGNRGYKLTSVRDGVRFDIRDDGEPRQTAWTTADSDVAFLVIDRNDNGTIDSGAELFGSSTPLASGARAEHGFQSLIELDTNHDGRVDRQDAAWPSLLLWTDRDHDGTSAPGELRSIAESGVKWVATSYDLVNRRDRWGNLYRYMSFFGVADAANEAHQRQFYDVLLTSEAFTDR